jgi:hypothetical protein
MAMTKCRECGQQISTSAAACPHCGAKPKRAGAGVVILLAIGVLVLIQATQSWNDSAKRRASAEAQQAAQQKQAALGAAQANAYAAHKEQVLNVARVALAKGDLAAAQAAIAPVDQVHDPQLDGVRQQITARMAAEKRDAEITKLKADAKALKSSDGDAGSRIYSRLAALFPDEPKYAAQLAKFQKVKMRADEQRLAKEARKRRQEYASKAETIFLDNWQSATVTTSGKDDATLRIEYVLVSKALVYQFLKRDGFVAGCKALGFKRLVFSDGYNQSWSIDLTKW